MSTCYIDTDGEVERLQRINAELLKALKECSDCLIWAAQESNRKVKKEIVGGWIHHATKAMQALERAKQ